MADLANDVVGGQPVSGVEPIHNFIGIGFGPSNLALAVAAQELGPNEKGLFFEQEAESRWHPGMMLEGSRMQVSFLKDLATLRNPSSPYTFLQYTKAKGRLERFVNLRRFYPTRLEYQDYLRWVAESFVDQVHYGTAVRRIAPEPMNGGRPEAVFRVTVEKIASGKSADYFARNLVYACGGTRRVPLERIALGPRLIHSSNFLGDFLGQFTDRNAPYELGVVGDGQSAAEIASYLLKRYPKARVHLFVAGYALRPADNSPFVNECFSSEEVLRFYSANQTMRRAMRAELRNTNYGVVDAEVLDELYEIAYCDEVKGQRRLILHRFSLLESAQGTDDHVQLFIKDRCGHRVARHRYDGVVLATGYQRGLTPKIFSDLSFVARDASGAPILSRSYCVQTTRAMDCRLYLQGYGESSHGLADTLLSPLAFRSAEIFEDMRRNFLPIASAHSPADRSLRSNTSADYPPRRYVEADSRNLYAVIERFKFATLISAQANQSVVTHLPLVLDRSRGSQGVLFGHMDRMNPHVDILAEGRVMAVFHGPNAYISPLVYRTSQLPTWNSIVVHVWGKARVLHDRDAVVSGLMRICEQADPGAHAYRLAPDDPRINRLIDHITGFEIEIEEMIGRFKLSQDCLESERRLAALELARQSEEGNRAFIEMVVGYRV
jgi:lysine/ornithine N-monooxygenase/predicted FMN-binding regulatory protein PaiB